MSEVETTNLLFIGIIDIPGNYSRFFVPIFFRF